MELYSSRKVMMIYSLLNSRQMKFFTQTEQVIDTLDRAMMTMKKGEVALVTIAPEYAFGYAGSNQELAVIPPNATVTYEIELITFIKDKESWDMTTAKEKIEAVGRKKEEGNTFFKTGPTSFALIIEMTITIIEESGGQYHVFN